MLEIGDVFCYQEKPEQIYRLIEMTAENAYTVEVSNSAPYEVPQVHSRKVLLNLWNERELERVQEELDPKPNPSENEMQLAKKRWDSIGTRWCDPEVRPYFLSKQTRVQLFKKIAQELDVTLTHCRRIITQFWRGGMTLNSLIPASKSQKNPEKAKRENKRGVKTSEAGLVITEHEEKLFKKAYSKYYLKLNYSLETTYTLFLRDNYTIRQEDESGCRYEYTQEAIPTYNQFYYWVRKNRNRKVELKKRLGEKEFENDHAIRYSTTQSQVHGVGARAELDATTLPIELVSEVDRNKCVGRPLLVLLVDVYSRMIMGFSLSLENESWQTCSLALINAAEDKVDFCRRHGIEIQKEDWPAQGLPKTILTDNGPFKSRNTRVLEGQYGLIIEYATPRKGSAKGNVERKHHTISSRLAEFLPGATLKEAYGRGAKDVADDASFTLTELTQILIREILQFNRDIITDYKLTPEMVLAGVNATPCQLWQWSRDQQSDSVRYVEDVQRLRLDLLPRVDKGRVIRQDGISLHNFKYSSRDPKVQTFMFNHLGKKVEICYNPLSVSEVYAFSNGVYYPLKLKEDDEFYQTLSVAEARYYHRLEREAGRKYQKLNRLQKISTQDYREEMIEKAQSEQGKKVKKDKKGNRKKERQRNRRLQNAEFSPAPETPPTPAPQKSSDVPELYLQQVKKAIQRKREAAEENHE